MMGCKYACTCWANCLSCSQYEPEIYFGEAEDILTKTKGFASDDEWQYHKAMERQQTEEYYRMLEKQEKENYYDND